MINYESEQSKFQGADNNDQGDNSNADVSSTSGIGSDVHTIRGHEVKVYDDVVVKFDYNEQEVKNLELLAPYIPDLAAKGIRIPVIVQKDQAKGTVTLNKLPFGKFPSTSEYFGEGDHDHISPLEAIAELRALCGTTSISKVVRQYGDNNDYDHFINLVKRQRTLKSDVLTDKFLHEVTRLAPYIPSLPRVVAHRDFTPANIKSVENYGCIMLDMATFGMSTYGADEGRWYVHHVLDKKSQSEILKTRQQLNPFGSQGDMAFLLMIGMRSARECKMLEDISYYDRHLQNEFTDPNDMSRFKNRLEDSLFDQLSWVSEELKQF